MLPSPSYDTYFVATDLTENSWYQTLPGPKLDILPVNERLPHRAEIAQPQRPPMQLTDLQREMIKQRQQRFDAFVADKMGWLERRAKDSRERSKKNIQDAHDVRRRYLERFKDA